MLLIYCLIALAAALIAYAVYVLFRRTVRSCAICAKPVLEREANPWTTTTGAAVYTHIGKCSDTYCNEYRAGEGP